MTELSPEQQGEVSQRTADAIRECLGWKKRLTDLAHECDDDDVAELCRDYGNECGYTAQRLTESLQQGTMSSVLLDQLCRERATVMGKGKSYTHEAVLAFGELMLRIRDVEPECRRDDDYD